MQPLTTEDSKTKELFVLNNNLECYISTLAAYPELQSKVQEQKTKFMQELQKIIFEE